MKSLPLWFVILLAAEPAFSKSVPAPIELLDIVEVQRIPLFENLPFVKLLPGERLVRGIRKPRTQIRKLVVPGEQNPVPSRDPELAPARPEYFLAIDGRDGTVSYSNIPVVEKQGQLHLIASRAAPIPIERLDFDLNVENARKLLAVSYHPEVFDFLNREQYEAAVGAVRAEFPLGVSLTDLALADDRVINDGGRTWVELPRAVYSRDQNRVFKYIFKIGAGNESLHPLLAPGRSALSPTVEGDLKWLMATSIKVGSKDYAAWQNDRAVRGKRFNEMVEAAIQAHPSKP